MQERRRSHFNLFNLLPLLLLRVLILVVGGTPFAGGSSSGSQIADDEGSRVRDRRPPRGRDGKASVRNSWKHEFLSENLRGAERANQHLHLGHIEQVRVCEYMYG